MGIPVVSKCFKCLLRDQPCTHLDLFRWQLTDTMHSGKSLKPGEHVAIISANNTTKSLMKCLYMLIFQSV